MQLLNAAVPLVRDLLVKSKAELACQDKRCQAALKYSRLLLLHMRVIPDGKSLTLDNLIFKFLKLGRKDDRLLPTVQNDANEALLRVLDHLPASVKQYFRFEIEPRPGSGAKDPPQFAMMVYPRVSNKHDESLNGKLYGTLDDALDDYFVHQDNLANYRSVKHISHLKKLRTAPPLLYVRINRYHSTIIWKEGKPNKPRKFDPKKDKSILSKSTAPLSIPPIIDLARFDIDNAEEGTVYALGAVIIHHGPSLNGGHYTAYVKQVKKGIWYNCDDSVITRSDEASAIKAATKDGVSALYYRVASENMMKEDVSGDRIHAELLEEIKNRSHYEAPRSSSRESYLRLSGSSSWSTSPPSKPSHLAPATPGSHGNPQKDATSAAPNPAAAEPLHITPSSAPSSQIASLLMLIVPMVFVPVSLFI